MVIEFLVHALVGLIGLIFSVVPAFELPPVDLAPAMGVAMALDTGLPVHEAAVLIAAIAALDLVIWAFDSIDWLYKHIPFIG